MTTDADYAERGAGGGGGAAVSGAVRRFGERMPVQIALGRQVGLTAAVNAAS